MLVGHECVPFSVPLGVQGSEWVRRAATEAVSIHSPHPARVGAGGRVMWCPAWEAQEPCGPAVAVSPLPSSPEPHRRAGPMTLAVGIFIQQHS